MVGQTKTLRDRDSNTGLEKSELPRGPLSEESWRPRPRNQPSNTHCPQWTQDGGHSLELEDTVSHAGLALPFEREDPTATGKEELN